jgi:hypothetical protein
MTNKLDISLLEKAYQGQRKKKKVTIPVTIEGETQDTVLEIDEIFSPSKIRSCVEEFVSRVDVIRKYNENKFIEVMQGVLIFQIIKHFTSFPAPIKFAEQVIVMNMLTETGLLYRIYAELDEKEIRKITEEISYIADLLEGDAQEIVDMAEKMGIGKDESEEGGVLVEKLQ